MGYETYHNLHIQYAPPLTEIEKVPDGIRQDVVKAIAEQTEDYIQFDAWDGSGSESYRWYDWDTDMIAVSKKFPSLLLTLWGDGEESDDKWVAYFVDGKTQQAHAQIVYPEFDPEKLEGEGNDGTDDTSKAANAAA